MRGVEGKKRVACCVKEQTGEKSLKQWKGIDSEEGVGEM